MSWVDVQTMGDYSIAHIATLFATRERINEIRYRKTPIKAAIMIGKRLEDSLFDIIVKEWE